MENLVGRRARILEASIPEIVGKTVKILYVEADNTAIIGFHKDSRFGWKHESFPGYKCWYVSLRILELIPSVTNSKFK